MASCREARPKADANKGLLWLEYLQAKNRVSPPLPQPVEQAQAAERLRGEACSQPAPQPKTFYPFPPVRHKKPGRGFAAREHIFFAPPFAAAPVDLRSLHRANHLYAAGHDRKQS